MCLSISAGAYFCWLCLTDTQDKLHDSYKCKVILALGESRSHYRLCVPPCKRKAFSAGDTHSLCVVCLRAEQAESALEGADCPCKKKKNKNGTLHARSRRRSLSKEPSPAFLAVPARFAVIKAERWLRSWESQMDQVEGTKTGESLSSSFLIRSNARSRGSEARPAVLSPRREGSTLRLPSSVEVVEDVDELCNQQALFHRCYERENGVRAVSP